MLCRHTGSSTVFRWLAPGATPSLCSLPEVDVNAAWRNCPSYSPWLNHVASCLSMTRHRVRRAAHWHAALPHSWPFWRSKCNRQFIMGCRLGYQRYKDGRRVRWPSHLGSELSCSSGKRLMGPLRYALAWQPLHGGQELDVSRRDWADRNSASFIRVTCFYLLD